MTVNATLSRVRTDQFSFLDAQHLLNRAGFCGTPAQIQALVDMGIDKAVDYLVDYTDIDKSGLEIPQYDLDLVGPATPEQRRVFREARQTGDKQLLARVRQMRAQQRQQDRMQMSDLTRWWIARMITTPRPLEEKLVLLWHGHFATQYQKVRDSYLMLKQNALFRKHASGNFAELAVAIVRDPAMLRFLDNTQNNRRKPNENLARELMELFTLGEGNYTEHDIRQGARALTGYGVQDNEFVFRRRQHDDGVKTILGRRGAFDGDGFARILIAHRACAHFVAYKLYKFFVCDLPDDQMPWLTGVVNRLAGQVVRHKYELRPVLKRLFKSQHFFDSAIAGNMIKSPVQLVIGAMRTMQTPSRDLSVIDDAMGSMGQKLFNPPSVAGWPGGRAWVTTSAYYTRQNLCTYLITGKMPIGRWQKDQMQFDPTALIAGLPENSPDAVVDHLMQSLLGRQVLPGRRKALVELMRGEITRDRLTAALLLITAMPEYQLM